MKYNLRSDHLLAMQLMILHIFKVNLQKHSGFATVICRSWGERPMKRFEAIRKNCKK